MLNRSSGLGLRWRSLAAAAVVLALLGGCPIPNDNGNDNDNDNTNSNVNQNTNQNDNTNDNDNDNDNLNGNDNDNNNDNENDNENDNDNQNGTNENVNAGNENVNGDDDFVEVSIDGLAFVPKEITISLGQTVRWTNNDNVPHTSTSGDPEDADAGALWDSGTIDPGESFTHTFVQVGEFEYYCDFHETIPAMRDARVTVEP